MPSNPPTGVCVVRVERQAPGVLITVTVNPDVTTRSGEESRHFSTVATAVRAVDDFLAGFARDWKN